LESSYSSLSSSSFSQTFSHTNIFAAQTLLESPPALELLQGLAKRNVYIQTNPKEINMIKKVVAHAVSTILLKKEEEP